MADLPEPMSSPDCDLRGMPYMPLDIVRLFDSDLYALSTGDEFKAALTLWGKAFLQVPAGSLPNNDRILAHLSCTGPGWAAVREMALRGWVECSDGRLYHPVVSEKAKEAFERRQAHRKQSAAAREALAKKRAEAKKDDQDSSGGSSSDKRDLPTETEIAAAAVTVLSTERVPKPVAETVTDTSAETVTGLKGREGKGRESSSSEAIASGADAPPAQPSARDRLWAEGVPIVRHLTGRSEKGSRELVGRMLKGLRDDAVQALTLLRQAKTSDLADPEAWLMATASFRSVQQGRPAINGATQLRREAEARGETLAEIPW